MQPLDFEVKFKIGKQKIWREAGRVPSLDIAQNHANSLKTPLAGEFKTSPDKIQIAVFSQGMMVWQLDQKDSLKKENSNKI